MTGKDKKSIEDKITAIISERLEINPSIINYESKLKDDLGIDSFGLVELIFEVKDKFGINIEEQDLKSIVTVKDVVEYIFNKI